MNLRELQKLVNKAAETVDLDTTVYIHCEECEDFKILQKVDIEDDGDVNLL